MGNEKVHCSIGHVALQDLHAVHIISKVLPIGIARGNANAQIDSVLSDLYLTGWMRRCTGSASCLTFGIFEKLWHSQRR